MFLIYEAKTTILSNLYHILLREMQENVPCMSKYGGTELTFF